MEEDYESKLQLLEKDYKSKLQLLTDEKDNWEIEKTAIASSHNFDARIKLDIGGANFTTKLTTLTRFPDTMIGAMFSGRHQIFTDESGNIFIDRDGTHFRHILNFLRCPEDFDPSTIDVGHRKELKKEANYYGLDDLMFRGW